MAKESLPHLDAPLTGRVHPDHLAVHPVKHFPAVSAHRSLDPDR